MKFENLNLEKFEKIEKNELGKLVGGAVEGWEVSGPGGGTTNSGKELSWSSDYFQRGPRNVGVTRHVINGGDIGEEELLRRLEVAEKRDKLGI